MKRILLTSLIALTLSACGNSESPFHRFFNNLYNPVVIVTPDGQPVDFSISPHGYVGKDTPDGRLEGYNQAYSFYGIWKKDRANTYQIYTVGRATDTEKMPDSGIVYYVGNAVRADGLSTGTSSFTVNFGQKTISGKIEMDNGFRRDVVLETGHINGNYFNGKAHTTAGSGFYSNETGNYEGRFYGPNANELAGRANFNDSGLSTVFGGYKQ